MRSEEARSAEEILLPSNNVQTFREGLMMSKAELARKAGLSTLTIDRVEAGRPCRLDTKRKILLALGMKVSDKDRVFGLLPDALEPGVLAETPSMESQTLMHADPGPDAVAASTAEPVTGTDEVPAPSANRFR
jgi:DNA-binding XRE family transcriptional regulator